MNALLEAVTATSLGLTAWHHAGFPLLLRHVARPATSAAPLACADLPRVTIVMPAYNEAEFMAGKLRNLAALDYPAELLRVLVACDGCADATAWLARDTLAAPECRHLDAEVIEHDENRGKVAVLNETIARVTDGIVVLSDVSAVLPSDALRRLAAHFADPAVGAVGGGYGLLHPSAGEARYWPYQVAVKRGEAALGAPLGLHGAFYGFRREAWAPIPADTINDDFVLPMQIFRRGWQVKYDETIVAMEAEPTDAAVETRRRRRIAAGNAQQLLRMPWLLSPARGGVALGFASGKALRVLAPALLALGVLGSIALAPASPLFALLALLQVAGLGAAVLGRVLPRAPRLCAVGWYVLAGHAASLAGVLRYAAGLDRAPWRRAAETDEAGYLPAAVLTAKRVTDIAIASVALLLSLPAWPFIALAIKLESPGPVLFRQLRIGRAMPDRTELFSMIKFRSMRSDAEARSGAVWAQKRDPRITRVGGILRKTRLDEIPQLINVIRGDMAIVGPRPERPGFYRKLENAIPFFAERTVGLRPGITGFAQVNQGYDANLDDVRRKVTFDHAYAMRLLDLRSWLASDTAIMARTIGVMVLGRGQ